MQATGKLSIASIINPETRSTNDLNQTTPMKALNMNALFRPTISSLVKNSMKLPSLRSAFLLGLLAGAVLSIGGVAHAAVITFDDLGSNAGGFGSVNASAWAAQKFNSDSTNLLLETATLRLDSESGGGGTFFLRLYADSAGQPGSSPLVTLATGTNPVPAPYPKDANVLFGGLNQLLAPNTNYWLVLGQNAGATFDLRWAAASNPTNPVGTGSGYQEIRATTINQGVNWSVSSGPGVSPNILRLTASPVPEPGSVLLGLVGGCCLLLKRRCHR